MVKSGLDKRIVENGEAARVSPYRLTAHLTSAFAIYIALLSGGITILYKPRSDVTISPEVTKRLKGISHGIAGFVLVTAVAGTNK